MNLLVNPSCNSPTCQVFWLWLDYALALYFAGSNTITV